MKHKPAIVLDTNTIISVLLIPDSNPGKAFELTLREALPVISSETFCELQSKVLLPKFDRYVSSDDRQQFLRRFLLLATLVPVSTIVHDCRDPKDNKFLELAIDAGAVYLISGDQDLLVLHPFRDIRIVTLKAFVEGFPAE